MFLRYRCKCGSESWMLDYDHDEKLTKATCLKCGHTAIIEELFGKKRRVRMEENQVQEKVPVPEEGFWAKWKEKNQLKKQQKQEQKEIKKAAKEYSKLTKEQIYLKSLFEIEKIVNHCKQRGWTTKEDWRKMIFL